MWASILINTLTLTCSMVRHERTCTYMDGLHMNIPSDYIYHTLPHPNTSMILTFNTSMILTFNTAMVLAGTAEIQDVTNKAYTVEGALSIQLEEGKEDAIGHIGDLGDIGGKGGIWGIGVGKRGQQALESSFFVVEKNAYDRLVRAWELYQTHIQGAAGAGAGDEKIVQSGDIDGDSDSDSESDNNSESDSESGSLQLSMIENLLALCLLSTQSTQHNPIHTGKT